MGVYSIDDKNIPFTDSVMALALVTDLAREMEGVAAPVIGGMYWTPEEERKSILRQKVDQFDTLRVPVSMDGEILGG